MLSEALLEELLVGLPPDEAADFRQMWKRQPPWGLGERPAVLVVDMVRGFLEDGFILAGDTSAKRSCLEANARLVGAARALSVPVVFMRPAMPVHEAEIGAWLRGASVADYAIGNEAGSDDFPESLRPRDDEIVITKPKPSSFFGTQLASILNYWHRDTVIVTGGGVARCLRATVDDAFALNYRVVIPIECVCGGPPMSQRVELLNMGVAIEVIADLTGLSDLLAELSLHGPYPELTA